MNKTTNKVDVLLGLQWGDEGKGKIVDYLTPEYGMIARFQGGPNAGHTLEFEGEKYILHTIPSGIFHDGTLNVIGNGVVIDPLVFAEEIVSTNIPLEAFKKRLLISRKAHLITPSHKLMDAALEASKGNARIGSTLRGIGPAYTDKIARSGIRVGNTEQPGFMDMYNRIKAHHIALAGHLGFSINEFSFNALSFTEYEEKWFEGIELLKSLHLSDSETLVNDHLKTGTRILAEGAQGSLLDIDFGSYPYVTSSNTVAAGACTGLGIAPATIGQVYGIFKAYCTRVGSGPFPTELFDKSGDAMRKEGNEFGSTTGRPRRCGWLDLPALKYATMLSGVNKLIMTKADVLSIFDEISICSAYKYKGKKITFLPFDFNDEQLIPVYQTIKGWKTDLRKFDNFASFPDPLKAFIDIIQDYTGVPVSMVSTGPDRTSTIVR